MIYDNDQSNNPAPFKYDIFKLKCEIFLLNLTKFS